MISVQNQHKKWNHRINSSSGCCFAGKTWRPSSKLWKSFLWLFHSSQIIEGSHLVVATTFGCGCSAKDTKIRCLFVLFLECHSIPSWIPLLIILLVSVFPLPFSLIIYLILWCSCCYDNFYSSVPCRSVFSLSAGVKEYLSDYRFRVQKWLPKNTHWSGSFFQHNCKMRIGRIRVAQVRGRLVLIVIGNYFSIIIMTNKFTSDNEPSDRLFIWAVLSDRSGDK